MKLVIDISEELYKNVVEHTRSGYIGSDVWIAVANGKPLGADCLEECHTDSHAAYWDNIGRADREVTDNETN